MRKRRLPFGLSLFVLLCFAMSAHARSVLVVNPGFETVSRALVGGEQTNGIGGSGVLVGTREPLPFGNGIVDWSAPVTVPGWRTFVVPFGSTNQVLAGVLRPTTVGGTPFVTGIEGNNVLAIQAAVVGQETGEVLQANTTYTLSFLAGISEFDSEYFFAVTLTAIDDTATLPLENQPGVTRLEIGRFFPTNSPDGVMRRYQFSYTSPEVLPASLVGTRLGINIFGSDGIPRVVFDDFTLTTDSGLAIPTVSEWGQVTLLVLLLMSGVVALQKQARVLEPSGAVRST